MGPSQTNGTQIILGKIMYFGTRLEVTFFLYPFYQSYFYGKSCLETWMKKSEKTLASPVINTFLYPIQKIHF